MNFKQYKKIPTPGVFLIEWKDGEKSIVSLHSPSIGVFVDTGIDFDKSYWARVARVILMQRGKMNAFNWRAQPAQTSLKTPYTPKPWNGLADPRSHARHGGISLPADPQACADKTAKILRGSPHNGNGK